MNSIIVVSCLLAVAVANPIGPVSLVPVAAIESYGNPNYNFHYAVNDPHTGDNKAQWESRHGDAVKGAYSLVEPDGTLRIVEYQADDLHGFNAVVKKVGANVHSVAPVVAHGAIGHGIAPGPIPLAHGPILHAPVVEHYSPVVEHYSPIIAHEPIISHLPAIEYLPYWPSPPLVSISGSKYGQHGLQSHWSAGPINLEGKTLTIRTKH